MKDPHEKPYFEQAQTPNHQDYKQTTNVLPLDFPPFPTRPTGKDACRSKESLNVLGDCIYEADNNKSKPVSHRGVNDILTNVGSNLNDISPMDVTDLTDENLMEAFDLSDLSFPCNDFILGDCSCLEEASQLVDPALKDSESTLLSFNNSDSVQLFRHSLVDSFDDNLTNFIKNTDNLFNYKNNSDRFDWMIGGGGSGGGGGGGGGGGEGGDVSFKSDHFNFYHVFEMFDGNVSLDEGNPMLKDEPKQRQVKEVVRRSKKGVTRRPQIQKGRTYLASFREKVLEYAASHTFKETALHFNINCNTITDWSRDSKRLSKEVKRTTTLPGSDYSNYKTDIVGTPLSKTEIILINDDFSLETDFNESSSSLSSSPPSSLLCNIEEDLPAVDMKPDERFLKWIEVRRVEGKELSRPEVFQMAKCCLRKSGGRCVAGSWFVQWFRRFKKALRESSVKSEGETEKYIKYPVKFKLEVALYARMYTKNSAARVFNVSRRRTFDWFSRLTPQDDSFVVEATQPGDHVVAAITENDRIAFQVKKKGSRSQIYSELHLWYQKRFINGARPTSYEIKEKAKEIFTSRGVTGVKFSDGWLEKFCQRMNIKLRHSEDDRLLMWVLTQFDNNVTLSHQEITDKSSSLIGRKQFKGSKGWTLRFLKRHKNLFQNCPTVQDQLPQIVQDKLEFFWTEFKQSLISLDLEPDRIGCMDEIPLSFTYPEGGKSAKLPLLRKTGFENCQGVVILCTLANGRILPPAVVFKGTGPKQLLTDGDVEILILYQENGVITTDILLSWANDIWLSCTQTPNALVVDSFEPHCTPELRQMLANEKSLLHIIPEGCSSRFQPLDVEVTPSFKEAIKKEWKGFPVDESSCSLKVMKKYRCPDQDTILRWVQKAYVKIKQNPHSELSVGFDLFSIPCSTFPLSYLQHLPQSIV